MKSKHRKSSSVNSGAMADVAFLLLVFFMVATTLQRDKAISMKLPPAYEGPAKKVNEDEVLTLIINVDNEIMVESDRVSGKYDKAITLHLKNLIHKNIKPIINIKMHPDSDYQSYLELLSSVRLAIRDTKVHEAQTLFGKHFDQLEREEHQALKKHCGIRIMEVEVKV